MHSIAFDFDGVLADTSSLKRDWFIKNKGMILPNVDRTSVFSELSKIYSLDESNEIYNKMCSFVFTKENLLKTNLMDENLVEYLDKLSQKHQLIIITNRPSFMLEWVREWLCKNNLDKYFSEILSSSNTTKGELALEYNANILIDDDMRHLKDERVKHNLLFKNWNHLMECIDYIDQKDESFQKIK